MNTDSRPTDDATHELTGAILGAAFAVSTELGHGFLEAVYRRALVRELKSRNLLASEEVPFKVMYRDEVVGTYIADLVVQRQVIVEIKAVDTLTDAHKTQVVNYLRASGLRVGLLLNFGTAKLGYRRLLL